MGNAMHDFALATAQLAYSLEFGEDAANEAVTSSEAAARDALRRLLAGE